MPADNIAQFFRKFPTDDHCLEHLFNVRFGDEHHCSKCGVVGKWHKLTKVRAYSCGECGHHLHPTVGTPFEKSRTSLQLWFFAIFLFVKSRNGVSAKELQRQLGVTYKTAWRMGQEIRKHMALVDGDPVLEGVVQVDETFVGGYTPGGQGGKGKAVVLGMLEEGGDVVTEVVGGRGAHDLIPHINDHVSKDAEVHTDELTTYKMLGEFGYDEHKTVDHSKKEYVGGEGQTTNAIEGYFSQLKRTINGTHIWVSPKHLDKYAKECEYRYNRRHKPDSMFTELVSTFPETEV